MDDIPMKSNPLVRSVIHQPFQHAVDQLGLPEFPRSTFTQKIGEHLHAAGSLFDDDAKTVRKLWQAVLRGDVVLTEVDGERLFFYVRANVGPRVMDIRLVCASHQWDVDSVVSMHRRPVMRSSGFTGTTLVLAVIVAGVIGYEAHGSLQQKLSPVFQKTASALLSPQSTSTALPANGNTSNGTTSSGVTPSTQPQTQSQSNNTAATNHTASNVSVSPSNATATNGGSSKAGGTTSATKQSGTGATPSSSTKSTSGSTAKQGTVSFTLKSGMPLNDLSTFLAKQGIIVESAATFDHDLTVAGIDRTIRPGTYTFHYGMTKQQIFTVLRNGK